MSESMSRNRIETDADPGGAPPPVHRIPAHLRLFTHVCVHPADGPGNRRFWKYLADLRAVGPVGPPATPGGACLGGDACCAARLSPVRIVGAEKLRNYPVAVYASNHLSYMDTPALFAKLPFQFRIMAKQSLWKVPFVGWYLKHSGQVPIDIGNSRSAIAGLLRGVAALKAGMPLVLFPEGSRSPDGHMQTAHSGCAFMALKAGVPLIPLALIGTYELLPIHVYSLRPRPLMIIAGDPIPTAGMTTRDADALTVRLYEEIGKMYYQYSDLAPTADSRAAADSHNATPGA